MSDMMEKKDEKLSTEDFIRRYKAAIKAKLSREQFAKIIGILPDSLVRRRLSISKERGLNLSLLPTTNNQDCSMEQFDAYSLALQDLEFKETGEFRRDVVGSKRYVITAAQNATPIHANFLACLLTYCEANDAEFIVIPYRYKNPTSLWNHNNKKEDWWAPSIKPYLLDIETRLSNHLVLMAHIKAQPTASEPVTGFEGMTGLDSTIVGHPKIQLKSVPTINGSLPKILTSTGAITIPNYTDSKAGCKGAFHHSFAALIVELEDDGMFHLRHVHGDAMTGEFYDLDGLYTQTEVTYGHRAEALVAGDIHAEFIDPDVETATYTGADSIASVVNPKHFVFHDLTDFYSQNHHHFGNQIIGVGKHRFGRANVEKGLQQAADFIDRVSRDGTTNLIIKSNHDEAFDRWLREADVRGDYENAQFYYYMKYNQMKSIQAHETGFNSLDPFEFWCNNPEAGRGLANLQNTVFLKRDDSFRLKGVELAFHGDIGPNGSRGSIKALSKLSTKLIIGHSHTPGIYESCVQVGVSSRLNLEYKKGPSSWMCSHAIVYPDGKRTLVNVVNGKWRL